MSIDVSEVLRNPGVQFPVKETLNIARIAFDMGDFLVTGPVEITGTMTAMDEEVFVKGEFCAMLERECDRCAERFVREYAFNFDEVFAGDADADEDDSDSYVYLKESLDLEKMVEDVIVLQAPTASLCREDCRGLCPICGANLNFAQCDCGATQHQGLSDTPVEWADPKKEE